MKWRISIYILTHTFLVIFSFYLSCMRFSEILRYLIHYIFYYIWEIFGLFWGSVYFSPISFLCSSDYMTLKLIHLRGFPGGAVVENLPANAGDTGSSPGLGRSHMPRSNWAREPQLLSLSVWSLCSETREAAIVRGPRTAMKSGPHSPQLEKALTQKRRPDTPKNKHNK